MAEARLYGVIDTARDVRLFPLVQLSPNYDCLFAGKIEPALAAAAPYLVELTDDTPLKNIWRTEGWGKAWGILLKSSLELDDLRRHLRKFLVVQLPDGDVVFFRFYDPRVWKTYWASCSDGERNEWSTCVDEFVCE